MIKAIRHFFKHLFYGIKIDIYLAELIDAKYKAQQQVNKNLQDQIDRLVAELGKDIRNVNKRIALVDRIKNGEQSE